MEAFLALNLDMSFYSVICDARIASIKLLSDRKKAFRHRVMLELTGSMNTKPGWSMAWLAHSLRAVI